MERRLKRCSFIYSGWCLITLRRYSNRKLPEHYSHSDPCEYCHIFTRVPAGRSGPLLVLTLALFVCRAHSVNTLGMFYRRVTQSRRRRLDWTLSLFLVRLTSSFSASPWDVLEYIIEGTPRFLAKCSVLSVEHLSVKYCHFLFFLPSAQQPICWTSLFYRLLFLPTSCTGVQVH